MSEDILHRQQNMSAQQPERNFIGEMNEVLISCGTATQLGDLRAAENAVRKARAFTLLLKNLVSPKLTY